MRDYPGNSASIPLQGLSRQFGEHYTSETLARDAKLDERYVREWLGGLTAAGVVEPGMTPGPVTPATTRHPGPRAGVHMRPRCRRGNALLAGAEVKKLQLRASTDSSMIFRMGIYSHNFITRYREKTHEGQDKYTGLR